MNDCRRHFGKKNTKLFLTREKHLEKIFRKFWEFFENLFFNDGDFPNFKEYLLIKIGIN